MPPPVVRSAPSDAPAPSLEDASARLEAALARLEALVEAGPLQSELFRNRKGETESGAGPGPTGDARLRTELDGALGRQKALAAAAAQASRALGHAIDEVRQALEADSEFGEETDTDAPLDVEGSRTEDTAP